MFTKVTTIGIFGLQSYLINVEADIDRGLPKFTVVGLPNIAVSESRERVRSAIKNCGFEYPVGCITVNLSPADVRKVGPNYDLPIMLAVLGATNQIEGGLLSGRVFIGELSLDGKINRVNGVLPMTIMARQSGLNEVYVPVENAPEASVVDGIEVYPVKNVLELLDHIKGIKRITRVTKRDFEGFKPVSEPMLDFSDVKGQFQVKRALEVAAAGGHNLMLIGPPGSGKSMLAKRLPSILPDMTFEESLETTKIHSIAGLLSQSASLISTRPFRSPHHSVSTAALIGGGSVPKPGEFSLANNGVLFLDELPEFKRPTLEAMRQPIEDGVVTVVRVSGSYTYPCNTMLVCTMNPCPCGYFGNSRVQCSCSKNQIANYLSRISGPLLDRLDIHVEVPQVEFEQLSDDARAESSAEIKLRVNAARLIQRRRFEGTDITCNANMNASQTREFCVIDEKSKKLLGGAFDSLGLSARAYDKILRVSRTIADLAGSEMIETAHIAEALQYRSLDRKYWAK